MVTTYKKSLSKLRELQISRKTSTKTSVPMVGFRFWCTSIWCTVIL